MLCWEEGGVPLVETGINSYKFLFLPKCIMKLWIIMLASYRSWFQREKQKVFFKVSEISRPIEI